MRSWVKFFAVGLCILCFICLSGCSGDEVIRITITEEEFNMDMGSARNLEAIVSPKTASRGKLSYYTSDESIAGYNNDLVVAYKPGTCVLYVMAGDVVSNLVKVTVHDFIKEATELRAKIERCYKAGKMSEFIAKEFSLEYGEFPEYAKRIVDNFYIVSMFKDYSDEQQVYITKSEEKYHKNGCKELQGEVREIPYQLAKIDGMQPCKICNPEEVG